MEAVCEIPATKVAGRKAAASCRTQSFAENAGRVKYFRKLLSL